MKKRSSSLHRGQTLVEFALILPIFIFLLVVIFDFGRAVYYYSTIHNAAREGARYGVIHPSTADYPDIEARARNYAIGLGVSDITVTVAAGVPEFVGNVSNPTIKVTVKYCFAAVTPIIEAIVPNDCACSCTHMLLTSDAVMRTEALP